MSSLTEVVKNTQTNKAQKYIVKGKRKQCNINLFLKILIVARPSENGRLLKNKMCGKTRDKRATSLTLSTIALYWRSKDIVSYGPPVASQKINIRILHIFLHTLNL